MIYKNITIRAADCAVVCSIRVDPPIILDLLGIFYNNALCGERSADARTTGYPTVIEKENMKAISLIQPWATAIMCSNKKIETRSWKTSYRGRVAIHASKGLPKWAREFAETERALGRIPTQLPVGTIIGFVNIVDMRRTEDLVMEISPLEKLYGDYSPGRWGWILSDVAQIYPVACKGSLGLWDVPEGMKFVFVG